MNRYLSFIFTLLIISNSFAQVNTDWKWVHPKPQGNLIRWMTMLDDNTWYAVSAKGIFLKTTNAGLSWTTRNAGGTENTIQYNGQGRNLISAAFMNANTGIVCGVNGWLARTTNAGETWDSLSSPVTNGLGSIYFKDSFTGYAGGNSFPAGVMIKSTDGGLTWTTLTTGATALIYNVYASGNNVYGVLTTGSIIISTNSGSNFTSYSTGTAVNLWDVKFVTPDSGFVCGNSGAFRTTTNGGLTWTSNIINASRSFYRFSTRLISGVREFYAVGSDPYNIYKSTNMGVNWIAIPVTAPSQTIASNNSWFNINVSDSRLLISGGSGLMNTSTNGGTNWTTFTSSVSSGLKYDVWAQNTEGKVWVFGAPTNAGITFDQVIHSSNGGQTWAIQPFGSYATFYSSYMIDANTGWISGNKGAVRKTTNGGLNWDSVIVQGSTSLDEFFKVIFVNANTGFLFDSYPNASGTIFKTTNAGLNWNQYILGTGLGNNISLRTGYFLNANTGWVINHKPSSYKTTNGGVNWIGGDTITGGPDFFYLYDIKMFDTATGYTCGGVDGVFCKTTNGGTNWNFIAVPYPVTFYSMEWVDVNTGWLFGSHGNAIKTTNGGLNWILTNTPMPAGAWTGSYASSIGSTDSLFVVGGGGGVFKMTRGLVGIVNWSGNIPDDFYLKQNYPNPFNPTTTFEFGISKKTIVRLIVYDITGREVETLIDNKTLNAGRVTVNFDGSGLASGIYFYTLSVDKKNITNKMILVK